MDLKSVFLHGDLQEEIYMKHPGGYISYPTSVCRLRKSLYGLKQAPRAWYAKMDSFLLSQNFVRCKSNPNVYLQQHEDNLLIIVLYVDDLLTTESNHALIGTIKNTLHQAFDMSDLGPLKQFLGLKITQVFYEIMISQ